MDLYTQIAQRIIQAQQAIIGPVAVEQAKRVRGLSFDDSKKEVALEGDKVKVVDALIEVYKELFGQISVEVSKEAAGSLLQQLPANGYPKALQ